MRADRESRRVLVLDGELPAALAIVRSLGRRGVRVDVAERRPACLSSHSRYAQGEITYPDPLADPGGFVRRIADVLSRTTYDLVIPVAEDTVQPLAAARASIEPLAKLAIAPSDALAVITDKAKTVALAEQLGVPIPKSRTFEDLRALEDAAGAFAYPVVVKPSRSISDGGKAERSKLKVMYAHDPNELVQLSKEPLDKIGAVIVQEYFRGAGVGVEILADRGEVVYAFQHKRLHELPLTGGGSCLRVSVPVNPGLLDHARALMRATSWHGVAMVEFKLDEATGESRLMEINGRFWGSLPLAVAAGADFPYYLLELLTRDRRPPADAPPTVNGVLSRKLLDDLYWYIQVLRPNQDEPLIEWPSKKRALEDLLTAFTPRHHFDVQAIADPRPGVVDAIRAGRWFAERIESNARHAMVKSTQARAQKRGTLHERLSGAGEILFVCHGNINRSVLAERHLTSLLSPSPRVAIRSAGFHQHAGRPPDPSMVREARRHGLELDGASSRTLDAQMIERADVVLAMEVKHLLRLHEEHPSARKKSFLLGAAAEPGDAPLEIADPYGGDEPAFARCFGEVTACTAAIARTLAGSGSTI